MATETVEDLVERSRRGDLDAFGRMVRRFQDMAHGYAYAHLGDFHAAEDVAQEAFIDAYRKLPSLRNPAAFPGWFRRIVRTHCNRVLRARRMDAVPLDAVAEVAATARTTDLREEVLAAIQALPERQRVATTLFYINGYSQNEVADFLEVPVTTVQKRLHDARKNLKERMMEMVDDTLKDHTLDERFSQSVIAALLARPRPLEIPGHPVREIADAIRSALSEYERIEGDEVVNTTRIGLPTGKADNAYHLDQHNVLRTETTITLLEAMVGRTPPVRLLTAGRVFRPDAEDANHAKVFHQIDVLCIAPDTTEDTMKATLCRAIESALGAIDIRWQPHDFPRFHRGYIASVQVHGQRLDIAGCGMMAPETLTQGGFDPNSLQGFAFGTALERLAMIKYGIDDIRKLWQAPYVPRENAL